MSESSNGIGFLGALTLIFITLKLCNVILWDWVYVLLPILMPIAIALGIMVILLIILLLVTIINIFLGNK